MVILLRKLSELSGKVIHLLHEVCLFGLEVKLELIRGLLLHFQLSLQLVKVYASFS